ncbi:MAG TPA: hypothetical protein VJ436_03495 [Anaerolineales bacterium]|nr:hypothetical protein [Anaerolineales bacterium]
MKTFLLVLLSTAVVILAACAPQGIQPLNQPAEGAQSGAGGGAQGQAAQGGKQSAPQLLQGGTPGVIEPNPDQGNASSGETAGGVISSSGDQQAPGAVSNEPGSSDSSASGSGGAAMSQKPNFLVYEDPEYNFSIAYPDVYVILPEIDLLNKVDQLLVHRVRFQDKKLASGDTANLELPQFTIEVFEKSGRETLEAFIDSKAPSSSQREAIEINGLKGFRIVLKILLAPNTFYYFSVGDYIYKLTPLGEYSEEMLQSFKVK